MKVLIPSNFTLVNSTIPVNEAQIFQHRIYSIGEKTVYGNGIYIRKTATDTFPAFDNKKWYVEGDKASFAGSNYLFQKKVMFLSPDADTANWEVVTVSAWSINTAYTVGQVRSKDAKTFLCIKSHTSPSINSVLDWSSGQASTYYTGGYCRFNNRYYKRISGFDAYKSASKATPDSSYAAKVWVDVSDVMLFPSSSSAYWIDITDQNWAGDIFYSSGAATFHNGVVYKAKNNIILPNPDTNSERWANSSTSIPTNKDDWTYAGATNRFRMFDQYITTYTESNEPLEISITDLDFNSIFIGNIFGDSVTIQVINNVDSSVVEESTIDLTYDCVDIMDYFLGDWMDYRLPSVKYDRTSVYSDVSATITFSGDLIQVGIFCIGKAYFIGTEVWDASIEALDFSSVVEDTATGEVYLQEGNELKVKSIDLWVETRSLYAIDQILKRAKGKPVVFLSKNENLDTYGFPRKKHEILKGPVKSIISLEVRELL
ncbi:hypothetical protein [Sulfuricurvum sp.]|uniref:hypothetical protein n=1 Tax=Sulfuricurvum sp. TaxID=2025608 RepID=UPI002E30BDCC|nr:hypothetical protein [Sulfuricurvum sp.]HEX5330787.1 hypothetical protein [Sulfuricurvum sp.]